MSLRPFGPRLWGARRIPESTLGRGTVLTSQPLEEGLLWAHEEPGIPLKSPASSPSSLPRLQSSVRPHSSLGSHPRPNTKAVTMRRPPSMLLLLLAAISASLVGVARAFPARPGSCDGPSPIIHGAARPTGSADFAFIATGGALKLGGVGSAATPTTTVTLWSPSGRPFLGFLILNPAPGVGTIGNQSTGAQTVRHGDSTNGLTDNPQARRTAAAGWATRTRGQRQTSASRSHRPRGRPRRRAPAGGRCRSPLSS